MKQIHLSSLPLAILVSLLFLELSMADDLRVENGTDPTGRFSIRICQGRTDDSHDYDLCFFDQKTGRRIGNAEVEWSYDLAKSAAETMKVVWHPSGEFVAFNHRDSKHSMELFVYSLRGGKPQMLKTADYIQNALGRVNAVEVGLHSVSTPDKWQKDDLFVDYYFSVDQKDLGRVFYNATIEIRLINEPHNNPRLRLMSVSQPVKDH